MSVITSLSVRNFRTFSELVRIDLAPLTLLIGPNSSGKSTFTRALQLLQDTAQQTRLTRLAFVGQNRLGTFERIHNRASGEPYLELGLGFTEDGIAAHVTTRWMPYGLVRVELELDGQTIAVVETLPSPAASEEAVELTIFPAFYLTYNPEPPLTEGQDSDDEREEKERRWTEYRAWKRDVGEEMWQTLCNDKHTVTWSHKALHVTPLEELYVAASFTSSEAQEVTWDGRLDDAAKRLITDSVLPRLADVWAGFLAALSPGQAVVIGAGEVRQRQVYLEEDTGLFPRLLREYHACEEAVKREQGEAGALQRRAVGAMRYWLERFGVADGGLSVHYLPGVGWTPWVRDSAWVVEEVPPVVPERLRELAGWNLPEEEAERQAHARTPVESEELEALLEAHFAAEQRAREEAEQQRALLPLNGQRVLADFGYGVTCLMPALLAAVLPSGSPALLALEEAEANLHPNLQSRLAELLAEMVRAGRYILMETHSEYLVRKLQYLVATGKTQGDDIEIYYLSLSSDPRISRIGLDERGALSEPFGAGFYDEATELMADLFRASRATDR